MPDLPVAAAGSRAIPPAASAIERDWRHEALAWWREADANARQAFVAASLGWMLDSFDIMLYSMVVVALVEDPTLHLTLQAAPGDWNQIVQQTVVLKSHLPLQ